MKYDQSSPSFTRRDFLKTAVSGAGGLAVSACSQGSPPATPGPSAGASIYQDVSRPLDERVQDLIGRMTREEKISQMGTQAPAIERLGIPRYDWWNEALHGVARAGTATVFPQVIGLAATWNPELIQRMATAISDEARAKHHEFARKDVRDVYTGLTFFCPNINIFRDPRWGRGQETYGEDPYLTARLAVAFVRGLQGQDERYLKLVATPKHFAVHSGPEKERHSFDAIASKRDMRMTYLPAFKACVVEGKAYSVMGAYNRVNGEAACASPTLLQQILRGEWGFEGYVVSDCGAIDDIANRHHLAGSLVEAAALAMKNGCDLECACTSHSPCHDGRLKAVEQGLLTEADVDRSLGRLFKARFRLGMFDPPSRVPYAQIPYDVVNCAKHRELALEVARQSLVLLKNEKGMLPLEKEKITSIAVIGPNADNTVVLTGNYNGTPLNPVSVLAGIRAVVSADTQVNYAMGCEIVNESQEGLQLAVQAAKDSQVAIVVVGLSQQLEGEEGQSENTPPGTSSQGDRSTLDLPDVQQRLVQAIFETGTPTILVLINGSAVSMQWASDHVPAILEAWYPGQAGGTVIAEALFGRTNPGGRLPMTFYRSVSDLPPFDDYSMANRTYRYFAGPPLYAFGFGLSYTSFAYRNLRIGPETVRLGDSVSIQVEVENTGARAGDEVVQLYVKDVQASWPVPLLELKGFARITLAPGEKRAVSFTLTAEQMSLVDDAGQWLQEPGDFEVWVGGQQPDRTGQASPANVVGGRFVVQTR